MTSIQCLPPRRVGDMSCRKLYKISLCHFLANHIITTFRHLACVHFGPIIFNPALGFCLSRQEIFVTLGRFFSKKKVAFIVIIINLILPLQINSTSALLSL